MSAQQANEAEKNIEIWKVKKLIKRLEQARGNGTSMISLIIRQSKSQAMLGPRMVSESALIAFVRQRPRTKCHERRECWLKNSYVISISQ